MIIGKFSNAENGRITGFIDSLSRDVGLTFVPQSKGAAYIVVTDQGCEAGWNRKSKDGGKSYISVKLDSPLPRPSIARCSRATRHLRSRVGP
jgi:uncharacterized protein (DUF736 family)